MEDISPSDGTSNLHEFTILVGLLSLIGSLLFTGVWMLFLYSFLTSQSAPYFLILLPLLVWAFSSLLLFFARRYLSIQTPITAPHFKTISRYLRILTLLNSGVVLLILLYVPAFFSILVGGLFTGFDNMFYSHNVDSLFPMLLTGFMIFMILFVTKVFIKEIQLLFGQKRHHASYLFIGFLIFCSLFWTQQLATGDSGIPALIIGLLVSGGVGYFLLKKDQK